MHQGSVLNEHVLGVLWRHALCSCGRFGGNGLSSGLVLAAWLLQPWSQYMLLALCRFFEYHPDNFIPPLGLTAQRRDRMPHEYSGPRKACSPEDSKSVSRVCKGEIRQNVWL